MKLYVSILLHIDNFTLLMCFTEHYMYTEGFISTAYNLFLGQSFSRQNINMKQQRIVFPRHTQAHLNDLGLFLLSHIRILVSNAKESQQFVSAVVVRGGVIHCRVGKLLVFSCKQITF